MKNHPLEIPYRLETTKDIDIARDGELFGEVDYKRLLHFAKEKPIQRPYALINARNSFCFVHFQHIYCFSNRMIKRRPRYG